MTPDLIKLLIDLKNPILMILGGIFLGLLGLITWMVKTRDDMTLKILDKLDPAIEIMNNVSVTIDTMIKTGRMK
jgi:hypothetical protein